MKAKPLSRNAKREMRKKGREWTLLYRRWHRIKESRGVPYEPSDRVLRVWR